MPWLLGSMPDSLRDWMCGLTSLGSVAFAANWGQSHLLAELPWLGIGTRHEHLRVVFSFPAFPSCPHLVNSFILGSGGGLDHHRIKTKVPGFLG